MCSIFNSMFFTTTTTTVTTTVPIPWCTLALRIHAYIHTCMSYHTYDPTTTLYIIMVHTIFILGTYILCSVILTTRYNTFDWLIIDWFLTLLAMFPLNIHPENAPQCPWYPLVLLPEQDSKEEHAGERQKSLAYPMIKWVRTTNKSNCLCVCDTRREGYERVCTHTYILHREGISWAISLLYTHPYRGHTSQVLSPL